MEKKIKKGKRAIVMFSKTGERTEKDVPMSRAIIIAQEYRKKTGKAVTIRLS